MADPLEVYEAVDVNEDVLRAAEQASEWFEGRIDWDAFWDRLEGYGYFVSDTASPAASKIERYIRDFRKEG